MTTRSIAVLVAGLALLTLLAPGAVRPATAQPQSPPPGMPGSAPGRVDVAQAPYSPGGLVQTLGRFDSSPGSRVYIDSSAFRPGESSLHPGSTEAALYVSGQSSSGASYVAPKDGVYRFKITGGAYQNCPPASQPDHPELWGWQTRMYVYENRPIQWTTPCYQSYPGPGNWDHQLGTSTLYPTVQEAEAASVGAYLDITLNQGQFVMLVVQDCLQCCFGDNSGGVNVSVHLVNPPVVLVHGWQGLPGSPTRRCSEGVGRFGDPGVVNTFGDMAQWFTDAGYDVWIAHLDTGPAYTPPIEQNAQCLRQQIAAVQHETGEDVILVAHSMGGLVGRACLGFGDCRDDVTALYTLGSPHAGVNSAFLLRTFFGSSPIGYPICLWQPAMCQFTTEQMLVFNLRTPNRGDGYYFIGGEKTPLPTGLLLYPFDGFNDGIVGRYSAVGWLYPLPLSVVPGSAAGRYWTDETHEGSLGHPSYFEASGGSESQAFRCMAWLLGKRTSAECNPATGLAVQGTQAEPTLSATTADLSGHLTSGQSMSHTLQVDTSDRSLFYLSWLTGTLSFTLTQPDGQVIDPAYADAHPSVVTYTIGAGGGEMPPFAAYSFTSTVGGLYTVTVAADDVGSAGADYVAFAALETGRTLSVAVSADQYQVGDTALFTATLQGPTGGITGADVHVQLARMDGLTTTITLADWGNGAYTTSYTVPDAPGFLQATFAAAGDDGGTAFTRQVDRSLAIAPHDGGLAGTYADRPADRDGDGANDALALDVGVTATQAGTYTLSADLVAAGQVVAHAAEYAVLSGGVQTITLQFDGRDICRSSVGGPYTVTHTYLVDLGVGGVPAQVADDVWVTAAYDRQDLGCHGVYLPLILKGG